MPNKTKAEILVEDWGTVLPFLGFEMDLPQLWEQYGGEWVEYPHKIQDIYDLLDGYSFARQVSDTVGRDNPPEKPEALAVITVGWGAPVEDIHPEDPNAQRPSQSDNRRRIALAVFICQDGSACSVLRFEDDPKGLTVDRMGTGSMADAIDKAAFYVWGAEFVARLMVNAERNKDENEEGGNPHPDLVRALPLLGFMAEEAEDDRQTVADRLEASLRSFLGGEQ